MCHVVCHRSCYVGVLEDCNTVQTLQDAAPTFFMASDEDEKRMWLTELQRQRRQALAISATTPREAMLTSV